MFEINWIAIILCVVASMIIGFLWYSNMLFAKPWVKLIGKKMDDMKNPGMSYALTTLSSAIMAIVLSMIIRYADAMDLMDGALIGLLAGLGFVATTTATNYLFEGRSKNLYLINVGYHVVTLTVMGAILGMMG